MTVLAIEEATFIDETHVRITAVVDEMRLLYRATRYEPDEWAPALCETTITLDPEEQIPLDEDGFCSYLDHLDPDWQVLDLSEYK